MPLIFSIIKPLTPSDVEILNFPTLTLFYAKDNSSEYYNIFLKEIAKVIKTNYDMFVIGMCSNDMSLDETKRSHIECGLL